MAGYRRLSQKTADNGQHTMFGSSDRDDRCHHALGMIDLRLRER
jgi:hypothetical protein